MSIAPHGSNGLRPLLVDPEERVERLRLTQSMKVVPLTSRESSDLVMLGIGAFTPLDGFMGYEDWKSCCQNCTLPSKDNLFWPIPITLSVNESTANQFSIGESITLLDIESFAIAGTIRVTEKYKIDKSFECKQVYGTTDPNHPGVNKVFRQHMVNIAGPVEVLSELQYPERFTGIYQRPVEARQEFIDRGWSTVAALQLRNPMHNSHAYLAKIAIEICDGVYIHQLLGKLKNGDIPAQVRVKAVDVLIEKYFRKDRILQGGYPMEMRYAGPREALLHAIVRQNYGCSHIIIGRDHAGVGNYYGPFDAQKIFDEIPLDALKIQPLKLDSTFYCYTCGSMASAKTCPHEPSARLELSGTKLRELLREGKSVPEEFSKPEVLTILKDFYSSKEWR